MNKLDNKKRDFLAEAEAATERTRRMNNRLTLVVAIISFIVISTLAFIALDIDKDVEHCTLANNGLSKDTCLTQILGR